MWKLCIEDDQSNRTVIDLVRPEYVIGRAEDNAIRLTERNISRHHARIWNSEDGWRLEDRDSTTGTYVNGVRVESDVVFGPQDRLRLGDYSLWLSDGDEQALAPPRRANDTTRAGARSQRDLRSKDRLAVVEGPNAGYQYPLSKERLLVGRGDECDIAIADTSVSRVHIDIERMPGGTYRVEDQDSSNGLRINGHDVVSATLAPGDLLELGDVLLTFIPRGEDFDPEALSAKTTPSSVTKLVWEAARDPRVLGGAMVAGLALGGLLFWVSDKGQPEQVAKAAQTPSSRAVEQAIVLLRQGDVDGAHAALAGVAPDSNLRASATFREIETLWADNGFARADATSDPEEKRQILQAIEKTPGVDQLRRRRAAEALAAMSRAQLGAHELPRASSKPAPPRAPQERADDDPDE